MWIYFLFGFVVDSEFWGNSSQFMKPFVLKIPNSTISDSVYATQSLSSYTDQCSTFNIIEHEEYVYFVLMTYFDNYNLGYNDLVSANIKCNSNWPMIFLYYNSSNGETSMVKPLTLQSGVSQQVYNIYIESLFMNSSIVNLQKMTGDLSSPVELMHLASFECSQNNALTYEDSMFGTSRICDSLSSSLNLTAFTLVCNTLIHDFAVLSAYSNEISEFSLENYHPIYTSNNVYIHDICVSECRQVSVVSDVCQSPPPSPPPPSPPPPLAPPIYTSCNNTYNLSPGWNSVSFIGNNVIYSTSSNNNVVLNGVSIMELSITSNILALSNFSSLYIDNTNLNEYRIYATDFMSFDTSCVSLVEADCLQQVNLDENLRTFSIRINTTVNINDIVFGSVPSIGDVIESKDIDDYQLFVYDGVWKNMTVGIDLKPYIGYYYLSTVNDISFQMHLC